MPRVAISDLCQLNPKKGEVKELDDSLQVTFCGMSDLTENGEFKATESRRLGDVRKGYTYFAEGDLLFAKITPCMENGKGGVATGLVNAVGFGSSEFHVLRPREGVDTRYLHQFLQAPQLRAAAEEVMTGSAGQKRVPKDFFKNCMIPLPPLEEQKRIAGILDEADQVRKKTQALIDKYDELAQSLFLDMFGDPVTNPKGWEVVKLEECCTIQGGATPKRNVDSFWGEGLDWFTPKDLSDLVGKEIGRSPEQITLEGLKSCSAKLIPANSLLLSSRAPIGHLAITTHDCCTNQGFQSLIPRNELVNVNYLYFVMKLSVPRLQEMGRGATFKEVSKAIVKGFEITLPPPSLQRDFETKIRVLTRQKEATIESRTLAKDNFNALLQKAFKGELT